MTNDQPLPDLDDIIEKAWNKAQNKSIITNPLPLEQGTIIETLTITKQEFFKLCFEILESEGFNYDHG